MNPIKKILGKDFQSKNMSLLQVDLSDEEDKQLNLYKIHHNLSSKQAALKQLLVKGHKPLNVEYNPEGFKKEE